MWAIFSISAAFFFAVVFMIDKYVLTKWVREPLVSTIVLGIIGLFASLTIYLINGFSSLSYFNIFLAFLSGIFWVSAVIFYFKALKIEEVSRIAALLRLTPLFVLVFATIFLGEVFTPLKYLGIFFLVIGAILISSKGFTKTAFKIGFGKAFWWMILSIALLSIHMVLMKYLLDFTDYWTIFAYLRIGAAIGLIPIFYIYFPQLIDTVKGHGKRVLVVMSASEILTLIALLFFIVAASIGYIALVEALCSIEPFFVLLFVVILSIFYPSILKEEIKKSIILQKLLATILLFVGAVLIT